MLPMLCPLQHVLAEDLKAADIEVGVARVEDGGAFRCGSSRS
jgi:hypothetical protein